MMTSMEWLPFISPFVWIMLILNGLALIPVSSRSQRNQQPTIKRLTKILFAATLVGWLLAIIAFYSTTPFIYRNGAALSEIILTPTLFLFGAVLLYRIYQGENILTFLLKILRRALIQLLNILAPLAPIILHLFVGAHHKYAEEYPEDERRRKEQERLNDIHLNYRGEFSGEDDINKY